MSAPFSASSSGHVDWVGVTFYDVIFPTFVFVVGVAIVFSLPAMVERHGRAAAHRRVITRSLILFALGVLYYGGMSNEWPGHPAARRAAAARALLSVRLAAVPAFRRARHRRCLCRPPARLLGADDLRAGARCRCGLVRARGQSRQLDRRTLSARPQMGRHLGSGRTAQHATGDRDLPAWACLPACS